MGPFESQLVEVLDCPAEVTWVTNTARRMAGHFDVEHADKSQRYGVEMDNSFGHGVWDVSFDYWRGGFALLATKRRIKSINAMCVFATLFAAVEKLHRERQPAGISFSASVDEGRSRVYNAIAKRFAAKYGYKLSVEYENNGRYFLLTRE